jgi:hypothetical protein
MRKLFESTVHPGLIFIAYDGPIYNQHLWGGDVFNKLGNYPEIVVEIVDIPENCPEEFFIGEEWHVSLKDVVEIEDTKFRKLYLTNNGNLLSRLDGVNSFYKPNGDFLRFVTENEFEFLSEECLQVEFTNKEPNWEAPMLWQYLWKTEHNDYSSFRADTCNNSGNYSFTITGEYYARKTRNGWQFLCVDLHSTSAEFSYDELKGNFQSDLSLVEIIGSDRTFSILTQYDSDFKVIDQLGEICTFPFGAHDVIHDPTCNYDYYPCDQAVVQLTFKDLRQRAITLKEIGFTRPNAAQRRKNKRPQNNRVRR